MAFTLRDWEHVFPLEKSHLQEPVDALRRLLLPQGGRGISISQTGHGTAITWNYPDQIIGEFIGIVTAIGPPDSPNDWTDARVWVNPIVFGIPDGVDGNSNSLINLLSVPPQDETGSASAVLRPICAINLPDVAGGGHSLSEGTPVEVLAVLDQENPPNVHFVIVGAGAGDNLLAGEFIYSEIVTVAQNHLGARMDRSCPLIPNS